MTLNRNLILVAAAISLAIPAVGQQTARSLADTHGSLVVGDLVFNNFQVPTAVPFNHAGSINVPGDAADIKVSGGIKPDGKIALTFTAIDPATGLGAPLQGDARAGAKLPSNLARLVTFDVTVANPSRLMHSITHTYGPNTFSANAIAVIATDYTVEPGTNNNYSTYLDWGWGPSVPSTPPTSLLPGGNLSSFRFGHQMEIVSGPWGGIRQGIAQYDYDEMQFELVPASSPVPSVTTDITYLASGTLYGGYAGSGYISLTNPAQAGGATVTLTNSDASTISMPTTVIVPQGARTGIFPITPVAVASQVAVPISASRNGVTLTASATVYPAPPVAVSMFQLTPLVLGKPVIAGAQVQGTVTLTVPSLTGSVTVNLASLDPSITVPPTVVIPQGAISGTFLATTNQVAVATLAYVQASYGGLSASGFVYVLPAPPTSYTLSVSSSNAGTIVGTPSGTDRALNCGSACSAKFNGGTTVTVTAIPSAGKSFVNWSDACTGSQPTCTIAITANMKAKAVFTK